MLIRSGLALVGIAAATVLPGCGGTDNTSDNKSNDAAKPPPATAPAKPKKGTLVMQMGEMFFRPKQVAASEGKLRISGHNGGQVNHEFILIRSSADPGSLPAPGGQVDEAKLKVVGEIPDVAAGETKSKTFQVKPGKYVFICNVPGHYSAGMRGGMSVK